MEKFIVGAQDCSFSEVITVVEDSRSYVLLLSNWTDLCRKLNIPKVQIMEIRKSLQLDKMTIAGVLYKMLINWKLANGNSATIDVLMAAFENCGMKQIADDLENRFRVAPGKIRINENTKWQEIDDTTKHVVIHKKVKFLGTSLSLNQIWNTYSDSRLESFLKKHPDGLTLKNVFDQNEFVLVNDKIPKQLEYYIERKLTKSCASADKLVNEQVFQHDNPQDVFVVQGKSWKELICLSRGRKSGLDRSASQIEKVTAKFILLEDEEDFEIICRKAGDNISVHLLRFRDGNYYLAKSHGSTANIQQYLADQIEHLEEKDFLTLLSHDSKEPVCISDTAGMGKTRLLASISHKMKRRFPERIVLFINIANVCREYISSHGRGAGRNMTDNFLLWITAAHTSSKSQLGQQMLFQFITTGRNRVELFIDGFDEVQNEEFEIAVYMLSNILYNHGHIRIFMTTRPHKRDEAETLLGVKAYDILPFQEEDQINFVTRYWHCKSPTISESDFREFAKLSIKRLKSNMKDIERDIAGIPLQCMLLADVCLSDAIRYANKGTRVSIEYGLPIRVNSISSMFKKHMEKRFIHYEIRGKLRKRYTSRDILNIKRLHVFHAMKLLFPEWADRLQNVLVDPNNHELDITDLFPFGIIEMSDEFLRFVHRTLAEYLIAEFLIESILSDEFDATVVFCLKEFLFGTVLKTEEYKEVVLDSYLHKDSMGDLTTYKFKHPVIWYFVNALVENYTEIIVTGTQTEIFQDEIIFPLISACALENYADLVTSIRKWYFPNLEKILNSTISQQYWSTLVIIAAKHDNIELFKDICDIAYHVCGKKLHELEFKLPYTVTPLHVAVQKGNIKTVAFILETLGDHVKTLKYLLHVCVAQSAENPIGMVNTKKQIISLILEVERKFLDERMPGDGKTPLHMDSIHVELLKCLIDEGADLTVVTRRNRSTFLHNAAGYVSRKEFLDLLQILGTRMEILKWRDCDQRTPIHRALLSPQGMDIAAIQLLLKWVRQFVSTELIVGNNDCSFNKIISILTTSTCASVLVTDWTTLSMQLDIPSADVEKLKKDLFLDKHTHKDALRKILQIWRLHSSNNATLKNLIAALRKCQWNDMADLLSKKFHRTDEETLKIAFERISVNKTRRLNKLFIAFPIILLTLLLLKIRKR